MQTNFFKDKVVVITGAGSGIGRQLALQLAGQGARLALNDLRHELMAATAATIRAAGGRVITGTYDVSDRQAVEAFAEQVVKTYGRVDGLINNAGMTVISQNAAACSPTDFARVMDVNFTGVLHHGQVFLPLLLQQAGAFLVNISSIFGLVGYAYQAPYVASKFAVRGFTESLRQELRGRDLLVSCVHPGGTKTNLILHIKEGDEAARKRLARAFDKAAPTSSEQAAVTILRGIRRRRNRILVGRDARLIDLLARLLPSRYHQLLPSSFDPRKSRKQPTAPIQVAEPTAP